MLLLKLWNSRIYLLKKISFFIPDNGLKDTFIEEIHHTFDKTKGDCPDILRNEKCLCLATSNVSEDILPFKTTHFLCSKECGNYAAEAFLNRKLWSTHSFSLGRRSPTDWKHSPASWCYSQLVKLFPFVFAFHLNTRQGK